MVNVNQMCQTVYLTPNSIIVNHIIVNKGVFAIVSIYRHAVDILFFFSALSAVILRGFACIRAALDKEFPKLAAGVAVVASGLHARLAVAKLVYTESVAVISKGTIYKTLHDCPLIGWLLHYARLIIGHEEVARLLCQWMTEFNIYSFFCGKMVPFIEALNELCEVIAMNTHTHTQTILNTFSVFTIWPLMEWQISVIKTRRYHLIEY